MMLQSFGAAFLWSGLVSPFSAKFTCRQRNNYSVLVDDVTATWIDLEWNCSLLKGNCAHWSYRVVEKWMPLRAALCD